MAATNIDLLQALQTVTHQRSSMEEVVTILSNFKNSGGAQAEALDILEQLRAESPDEATEDYILEMMDIATGFCAPRLRVW
jgi:hypothetical protein